MAHWHWICTDLAADTRLQPGAPLHRRLEADGWSSGPGDQACGPASLVNGIFDTKFKLNVDRMGLDPQRIRDNCAWIIGILHYRQCAAELCSEKVVDPSNGHCPSCPSPIGNLKAYAWRLFSRKAAALPSARIDKDQQAQDWACGFHGQGPRVQSICPVLDPQPQEFEAAAGARSQFLQGRQSGGSATSSAMLDEGRPADNGNGDSTNAHPGSAPVDLGGFAAGFQAAANYLLLGDQGTQEPEHHTADDVVAVPRYQLVRLVDLLSQQQPHHAASSGAA